MARSRLSVIGEPYTADRELFPGSRVGPAMTTEHPSRTDARFEKWQTSMPMHVRLMPIRGQQALPLDPDANARQQHLERWGTVHAPIGKPYEAGGRMLINLDTVAAAPLERVFGIGECQACGGDLHWYPATSEDGWKCCHCGHRPGEPEGYDPFLDRYLTGIKVGGLLNDLHRLDLIYVSNGTAGDGLTEYVARQCRERGSYTQTTILGLLIADRSEYWDKLANEIITGTDTRTRCPGGRISTWSTWAGDTRVDRCSDETCTACAQARVNPF